MTIKIETNVPIPESCSKYPFRNMKVGDSFSFPKEKYESVRRLAHNYSEKNSCKFKISKLNCRCWRVG